MPDESSDPDNGFHTVGQLAAILGILLLLVSPMVSFTDVSPVYTGFFLFLAGAGLIMVGDIREYGEIPMDPDYEVPEDPTDILDE